MKNIEEYVELAVVTESPAFNQLNFKEARTLHATMGLCTESAELLDTLKKKIYYGRDIDQVNLAEELGDIFWYIAILVDANQLDVMAILDQNIAKLQARYPQRFASEAALNRDLDKERETLEGFNTKKES